jgi:hypothetical protein
LFAPGLDTAQVVQTKNSIRMLVRQYQLQIQSQDSLQDDIPGIILVVGARLMIGVCERAASDVVDCLLSFFLVIHNKPNKRSSPNMAKKRILCREGTSEKNS